MQTAATDRNRFFKLNWNQSLHSVQYTGLTTPDLQSLCHSATPSIHSLTRQTDTHTHTHTHTRGSGIQWIGFPTSWICAFSIFESLGAWNTDRFPGWKHGLPTPLLYEDCPGKKFPCGPCVCFSWAAAWQWVYGVYWTWTLDMSLMLQAQASPLCKQALTSTSWQILRDIQVVLMGMCYTQCQDCDKWYWHRGMEGTWDPTRLGLNPGSDTLGRISDF